MPQDLISQFDRKYALPIETYRQVLNLTLRNGIPDSIRWEGMMCYVVSEGKSYVLTGGLTDSDWVEFGTLVNVNVVDNLLSTSGTDALSANQGRVLQTTKLSDAPSDGNTYGRLDGAWAIIDGGAVDSVFGRTGAVVAQTGDYTFAQIGSKPTTIGGYGITDAVPTSRNINAGLHLSGGGNLSADRTLTLTPAVNQYVVDSQGKHRMYFAGTNSSIVGIILRASLGGQEFQYRTPDNLTRWRVDTSGNSIQTGTATATNFIGNWNGLDSTAFQTRNEKGAANGYTPLDSGAKVPIAYLPDSVIGQVQYQGTWAASTNTPTLANPPSTATKGHYYVASDNGTQFGISFQTGDWIISNGTAWEKVDNTDAVTSVFGRIGAIVANAGDYTFAQIGSKPTTISGYGITDAVPTSRTLTAGTGLTGGGNLTANRSFALDTGYTDERYAKRVFTTKNSSNQDSNKWTKIATVNIDNQFGGVANFVAYNQSNNTSGIPGGGFLVFKIKQQAAFGSDPEVGVESYNFDSTSVDIGYVIVQNTPTTIVEIYIKNIRTFNVIKGTVLSSNNDSFVTWHTEDSYHTSVPGLVISSALKLWHSGNLTPSDYVPTSRTLTAGDGLTGGGNLTANRSFAVDSTVVRTTGTQSIGGAKTFTSNVIGSGTFTGTNFILSSDRRLKKDINDYTPVHIPIRWREFTWKESGERQIGTIAQETPKQFVTKGADGKLAVKTVEMLMAKVAELEARIINLER